MLEKLPDALGHALRDQRAGLEKIVFNQIEPGAGTGSLKVTSLAFADHAPIPAEYTADGAGVSPPLQWSGVPSGTVSVVLVVEDADAPGRSAVVDALRERTLASGYLVGAYQRPDGSIKNGQAAAVAPLETA